MNVPDRFVIAFVICALLLFDDSARMVPDAPLGGPWSGAEADLQVC